MANGETSDGDQEEQRKKIQLNEDVGNPFLGMKMMKD